MVHHRTLVGHGIGKRLTLGLALLCFGGRLHAWNGHEATEHGLRVSIPEIGDIATPHTPTEISVTLDNTGDERKQGTLALRDFVDAWGVEGPAEARFQLAPGESRDYSFKIVSGRPFYAALYPVHAYATFRDGWHKQTVHAVRIFGVTTQCPQAAMGGREKGCVACRGAEPGQEPGTEELPVLALGPNGALALWREDALRVGWRYYDGPIVWKPAGWLGSDPACSGSATRQSVVRGDARPCINMHPPWRPGGGTIWCDFRVSLPSEGPVKLRFANAVRDNTKTEPVSDGVLFRVWAFEGKAPAAEPVFSRLTDSKVWLAGEADLTPWLGKTVTLRLESHPGLARDTQCDSSYWAEPLLVAGESLVRMAQNEGAAAPAELLAQARALASGSAAPDNRETYRLDGAPGGPFGVVVKPGSMGLLDGWFVFASADSATAFRGIDVELLFQDVGRPPARCVFRNVTSETSGDGLMYVHDVGERKVNIAVCAISAGLCVTVASDERITRLGPNAWNAAADRVFWGHGYVIDRPRAFRMGFGGHSLATSHVAFEFNDLAVLQACDTPPTHLSVDPKRRIHALYTRENSTLTFVPANGAMNAAMTYRPMYDKSPAAGVERLAGRMCFDIWGGKYGAIRDRMREAVRLGLTDSFLTVHNWQRWGYDYRLPDIWPPNSGLGTVDELRELGQVCRAQDIPWGLHDNYIDFYPDAEDYSYEDIYFHGSGQPHKAWHNRGREAYSYKWRPDRIMPFLQRNFRLVKKGVAPTHSFLDVFTSSGCMDWWDWNGTYHSGMETRKHWGEAFAWIRDYLGDNAPTTSEAGHDQLIGYLDGADCQWLTLDELDEKGRKFVIGLPCADWERVPWYDAVNHANFILHGVGYSSRYQGELSRTVHGINSDDYISMEALSGHALMVDSGCWGGAAARKYYLLQDVMRRLALHNIASFEFVDGNIHRQRVVWDDGTEVLVNRGKSDWTVAGRTLPMYGFLARNGDNYAVVAKSGDTYVEASQGESGWFCNARTHSQDAAKRVFAQPSVQGFRDEGNGVIGYDLVWDVYRPHDLAWRVFVHFADKKDEDRDKISFQDDHEPNVPTDKWSPGRASTHRTLTLPDGVTGTYDMMVGLYSNDRGRAILNGVDAGSGRILLGKLRIDGRDGKIASVAFTPPDELGGEPELPPTNPPGTMVDFGFARTDGAFRVQTAPDGLRITPLPVGKPFTIALRLGKLTGRTDVTVTSVAAEPVKHAPPAEVAFTQTDGELTFRHAPEAFAYDVDW